MAAKAEEAEFVFDLIWEKPFVGSVGLQWTPPKTGPALSASAPRSHLAFQL